MPSPNEPGIAPSDEPTGIEPYGVSTPATPPPPPSQFAPPISAGPLPPPGSGKATASLVLGIVSCVMFCFCYGVISIVCGILAIVFAKQAEADIAAGRASPQGSGQARTGRVCGIVGLCLVGLFWIVGIGAIVIFGLNGGFKNP